MSFRMNLWKIDDDNISEITETSLDIEERLENWIVQDPTILGVDLLIIGRQVVTEFRSEIDLLAIDQQGDLVIIELKRSKTPRDIVAQVLDYASWVNSLTYNEINSITSSYWKANLSVLYSQTFGDLIPEKINNNHRMVIVASRLDDSTERIVQYLAAEHDVNINVIFFSFFEADDQEFLGRAWLMDPEMVQEKSDSKKQPLWTGFWFVNVGESDHRNWKDNIKFGYIGAGQGPKYSRPLKRLSIGDPIFAYMSGHGYVGYGEVNKEAVMIKNFIFGDEGHNLLEQPLTSPKPDENKDDPELSEWAIRIDWEKTFFPEEAKTFKGVFSNPNVVCKLRHEATLDFLRKEFEIDS